MSEGKYVWGWNGVEGENRLGWNKGHDEISMRVKSGWGWNQDESEIRMRVNEVEDDSY